MKYFVVLLGNEKKIVSATPENKEKYRKNIIFTGRLKSCLALVEGCNVWE